MVFQKQLFLIIFPTILCISGCTSVSHRNTDSLESSLVVTSSQKKEKVIYNPSLRSYTIEGKVIRNEKSEKITNEQEAHAYITDVHIHDESNVRKPFFTTIGYVLLIPGLIVGGVGFLGAALVSIPAFPFLYYADRLELKSEIRQYEEMIRLVANNNPTDSRTITFYLLNKYPSLGKESDIYYWLSKTYHQDKTCSLELRYLRDFIKYAERRQPLAFSSVNSKYHGNQQELEDLFKESEARLMLLEKECIS